MIAEVGSKVRIDMRARASPGSGTRKLDPKESKIVEPGALTGPLFFAVVLLSCTIVLTFCAIVLLGAKILSG